MTKFVMLGSCRFEPYEFLAVPNKVPGAWNTDEGYEIAAKKFYPAIDVADVIIVYAPDGVGEHTQRDIDYAQSRLKPVFRLVQIQDSAGLRSNRELVDFSRQFTIDHWDKGHEIVSSLWMRSKMSEWLGGHASLRSRQEFIEWLRKEGRE